MVFLGRLLLMLISGLSIAQTTTSGSLTGVVTDPSGAVIPNADVEIKNTSKGTTQSAITDREGGYRFFFLAPARYTLTVARAGFETEKRAVDVLLGPPVTVNIALRVAQAKTTVSVIAEAPLMHADNGDVSTTFNASQISEVPNPGNDLVYSVLTTPGAIMSLEGTGGASLLGMPATSNVITIDGMNENENGNNVADVGSLNLLLGENQIEEVTVVGTPYSGQAGGVAGGQISFLTKSGVVAVPGWVSHPRISRDGKRIAFCRHVQRGDDRGSITVIDSDGGGTAKSFGDFASLYGLAWSPKDDEVWFTADPAVTTIARRLMAVTLSGKFRLLAAAPGDLTLHDVSPEGTAIITIDDRERKIFFSDSKDIQERDLTWLDRAVLVALSADGKQVLFNEAGKGGGSLGTIFLRKTDGSAAVRLGEGYAQSLSPDQKWVLANTPTNPPRHLLIPTGAGEVTELKPTGVENVLPQGFAADSRRIVLIANEPGHQDREFLFDVASGKLQPVTPEGIPGQVTPDGKFLGVRGNGANPQLIPVDSGSPVREIKGLQDKDRPIQISADGNDIFVANYNGLSASIYRVHLQSGERRLVKTLEMRDPTGGFGVIRATTTPDGQYFAYGTLRQLSELYLLQGLH